MSARALCCDGSVLWPYCARYWEPNRRTTSASSTPALDGAKLGSTMAGPPSLEEALGGLRQELAELVPQGLGQVGVDLGGSQARMSEQERDHADVDAPLEQMRGETVTQRG